MNTEDLRQRTRRAAAANETVSLTPAEAEALLAVLDAAGALFATTVDRNVARRQMERLQLALARWQLTADEIS